MNQLTLRTLNSPYNDITKGSVLAQSELDQNFINLKSELIVTGTSSGNTLTFTKLNGENFSVPIDFSGGTGSTIDQNNVGLVNYVGKRSGTGTTLSDFLIGKSLTVSEINSPVFITVLSVYFSFGSFRVFSESYFFMEGKGVYPDLSLYSDNLILNYIQLPSSEDVYSIMNDANTVTYSLGTITDPIYTVVNNTIPSYDMSNSGNTYLFIYTLSGETNTDLFIGPDGYYGLTGSTSFSGDYVTLLNSTTSGNTNPTPIEYWSGSSNNGIILDNNSNNIASGNHSFSNGYGTKAIGSFSSASGYRSNATGVTSHSEGHITTASGDYSHAEGLGVLASGQASHAEGNATIASGLYSHSEGNNTTASGESSHAEGRNTIANDYSHAEGIGTIASGDGSHAEGQDTMAIGEGSHAEGFLTIASGNYSHVEGRESISSGTYSHAEGTNTTASGSEAHAEGFGTTASADYSHSQGSATIAGGIASHAGGDTTIASGITSFIHSTNSIVLGDRSVVLGGQNITGTTADSVYVPDFIIKKVAAVPTNSADAVGEDGSITWDDTYFYWKANGQWLRLSGSTF